MDQCSVKAWEKKKGSSLDDSSNHDDKYHSNLILQWQDKQQAFYTKHVPENMPSRTNIDFMLEHLSRHTFR